MKLKEDDIPALRAPICWDFFLYKMLTKQWYIQKISALRALISYEFLKTSSAQKLYSFKISMSINFSEIQWVREKLSSTLGQF